MGIKLDKRIVDEIRQDLLRELYERRNIPKVRRAYGTMTGAMDLNMLR